MTEGQAGQAISISGIFAVLTSLLTLARNRTHRPRQFCSGSCDLAVGMGTG
jgi:predicted MFS family arabinose efflux permease